MDIHKWLANTQCLYGMNGCSGDAKPHKHHPTQREEITSPAGHEEIPTDHKRCRENPRRPPTTSSHLTSASTTDSSSSVSWRSEHFERRKRHKTREGLYEPNSGVRNRRSRPKDDKKAKKKRKKEKHHRTEKSKRPTRPGQQLLQKFSAPNVGDSRLTVRRSSGFHELREHVG